MKTCPNCKNNFKESHGKIYCSSKCYVSAKGKRRYARFGSRNGNAKGSNFICKHCGGNFISFRGEHKYCSPECSSAARKKYLSIPECLESASRKLDKKIGYVRVYCPMHPEANTWGYVYEHRLIMEGVIGRHLRKDEHIHHINGKRWDNGPENLKIMSPSEHSRLSFKGQE